jgi:hypothetical protein
MATIYEMYLGRNKTQTYDLESVCWKYDEMDGLAETAMKVSSTR